VHSLIEMSAKIGSAFCRTGFRDFAAVSSL